MLTGPAHSFGDNPLLEDVRVLVVEGDLRTARMLSAILEREGSEVCVAASAEDALDQLRVFAAHAVILDLVLPRMSGLLLARQLRHTAATRHAVLIAISAIDSPCTAQLAQAAGCSAYLSHPVDLELLPQVLAEHFERRRA